MRGAARLGLVRDRRRRMGEGRAAGVPWGAGLGQGDLGRLGARARGWKAHTRRCGMGGLGSSRGRTHRRRDGAAGWGEPPPSSPGGFHPEALTEPCVTVSSHTARAMHRRLPPAATTPRLLLSPVGPPVTARMAHPLGSTGIPPLHRSYEVVRPCSPDQDIRPRGATAWAFSLPTAAQVLKFRTRAKMRVTPPVHRTPHGQ